MKKIIAMLCVAVGSLIAMPGFLTAEVITLRLADQNPETGWGPTHAMLPWIKKVEDATGGRVKIEPYFSQTLAKGKDSWTAVKNGIADMAWCAHGYWPGMTPMASVITLAGLPIENAEKGSEVLWSLYEKYPEVREEYKDNHVLFLFTTAPYHLITTEKQVKVLDDLKGMKIRTFGDQQPAQMKAYGAVPMSIPMPDTYSALQKGVVDGMAAPWDAIFSFRLYEVAPKFTYAPFGVLSFSVIVNKDKWASLPEDIKEAINSVSGMEAAKFFGANYFDSAKPGVLKKAKETGHEITEYAPPAEELKKWEEIGGQPLWENWVKQMEEKGHPKAREILNSTLDMVQ